MLRAERTEQVLVGIPVGVVAVHRLAADGPLGRLDVLRAAHGETADFLEARVERVELLPSDARLFLRGLGRLVVIPCVPALDLRRVLESDGRASRRNGTEGDESGCRRANRQDRRHMDRPDCRNDGFHAAIISRTAFALHPVYAEMNTPITKCRTVSFRCAIRTLSCPSAP